MTKEEQEHYEKLAEYYKKKLTRAKLVSIDRNTYTFPLYYCECIKCGNIYQKFAYNKRTTPYCLDCIKERDKDNQKKCTERKQQEYANKILNKVKAEIKSLQNKNPSYWYSGDMVDREEVLEIINKHIGGTE